MIEFNENSGTCQAQFVGGSKLEDLYTHWGAFATWDLCNRCSRAVDVRLRSFSDSLPSLFLYTRPPFDNSNEIEKLNVCPGHDDIFAKLAQPENAGSKSVDYQFSWRFSGTLPWTDIDPRLEIERDRGILVDRLRRLWSPTVP